ncbi:MAG: tetratricopeptide repeat protein, partial [Thermodesulfovibrionales bacterium]|nr:tetratricopeptide repeat protein [Thermodesulfovibrionales bacterium]
LSGITVYCILTLRKKRLWTALWAFYVISLLPVLNIIQAGSQGAADRYTYLPLLAPMMLVALAAAFLFEKAKTAKRMPLLRMSLITLTSACLIIAMMYSTHRQIPYWKDSITLWTRERAVYPYEPLAYNQLANAYLKNKDYRKAEFYITTALQLNPRSTKYYLIRSEIYMDRGQYSMALKDIESALGISPRHKKARRSLEIVKSRMSRQ